jgi:hypothetical protein
MGDFNGCKVLAVDHEGRQLDSKEAEAAICRHNDALGLAADFDHGWPERFGLRKTVFLHGWNLHLRDEWKNTGCGTVHAGEAISLRVLSKL